MGVMAEHRSSCAESGLAMGLHTEWKQIEWVLSNNENGLFTDSLLNVKLQ